MDCHLVVLLGRLVVVPLLPLPVVVRGRPAVAVPLLASVRLLPHTEPPQPVLRSLLPGPVHLAATLAMSHVNTRERERLQLITVVCLSRLAGGESSY